MFEIPPGCKQARDFFDEKLYGATCPPSPRLWRTFALQQLRCALMLHKASRQKNLQQQLMKGSGVDTLIICEHPPVITLGTAAKKSNLLATEDELSEKGVKLYQTGRGGDVTFHGPGQLVAYPIIDLKNKKRDVGWYVRTLEETIIQTLKTLNIEGVTIKGKTGVWTSLTQNANNNKHVSSQAKIASIGIRISRWCTLHGIALNVRDCTAGFKLINPCGLEGVSITSINDLGVDKDVAEVSTVFVEAFKKKFYFI